MIRIQNDLFIVGSDLANPNMSDKKIRTTLEMVTFLEQKIDVLESSLKPLTSFILPGGTLLASIIHLSRTISRRAETHVVELSKNEEINKVAAIYLNRLSDLMFVLARSINNRKNVSDVLWTP
jgi:cob(I)alamin adenosyltransferase